MKYQYLAYLSAVSEVLDLQARTFPSRSPMLSRVHTYVMLAADQDKPFDVSSLADNMGVSKPTVSRWTRTLEDLGFIERRKVGKWLFLFPSERGREIHEGAVDEIIDIYSKMVRKIEMTRWECSAPAGPSEPAGDLDRPDHSLTLDPPLRLRSRRNDAQLNSRLRPPPPQPGRLMRLSCG